jgi:hypothetical protein
VSAEMHALALALLTQPMRQCGCGALCPASQWPTGRPYACPVCTQFYSVVPSEAAIKSAERGTS